MQKNIRCCSAAPPNPEAYYLRSVHILDPVRQLNIVIYCQCGGTLSFRQWADKPRECFGVDDSLYIQHARYKCSSCSKQPFSTDPDLLRFLPPEYRALYPYQFSSANAIQQSLYEFFIVAQGAGVIQAKLLTTIRVLRTNRYLKLQSFYADACSKFGMNILTLRFECILVLIL